ncbi:MAG: ABC transporter ATP-binding protein [Rhodocyclaceae bacterium]|jgi:zinc/manganese transport system ATP-binding protein|nr:ABC transporter ATP-binding protein [Rhodocyclaceae bacterium]
MIRLENLTLGYERHPAVHHLNLTITKGDLVAVVGPNGAGKSTLLKGLAGEIPPLGGHIHMGIEGRHGVAYLPQKSEIDTDFPLSVFDLVALGLWRETGPFGRLGSAGADRIRQALAAVGLEGFERRPIGTLSGGQFQRARFARLLLQDAPIVLLDEPFAAIDTRTTEDLMRLVLDWHCNGRTVLAVLHDLEEVRRHFPTCLLVAREPIAFGDTARVLSRDNLKAARRRSEVFDDHAPVCRRDPEAA